MLKTAVVSVVCAVSALGQGRSEGTKPVVAIRTGEAGFVVAGVTGAMMGPAGKIIGAPYSAEVVTQHVQILGDGNRIEQSTTGSVARDGQGRVRRDEALPALAGGGEAPHLIMIDDPVAQVHWTLDAQTKTATKMPMPAMPPMPPGKAGTTFNLGMPAPPPVPMAAGTRTFFATTAVVPATPFATTIRMGGADGNRTDLGTQNVEGVPAQGTRITRTIEAGQMGNSLPIVITTETWFSPELKVLVTSKSSDPRIGDTTYKLTNIQRAEPDPSLFQVPADYTIRDQPENTFFFQPAKKEE